MAPKLQCGVCLTEFELKKPDASFGVEFFHQYTVPLVLLSDCYHGFCMDCIMKIIDLDERSRNSPFARLNVNPPRTIECPICRRCSSQYSLCTMNKYENYLIDRKYFINFNMKNQFNNYEFKDYVKILFSNCIVSDSAPGSKTSSAEPAQPASAPAPEPEPASAPAPEPSTSTEPAPDVVEPATEPEQPASEPEPTIEPEPVPEPEHGEAEVITETQEPIVFEERGRDVEIRRDFSGATAKFLGSIATRDEPNAKIIRL